MRRTGSSRPRRPLTEPRPSVEPGRRPRVLVVDVDPRVARILARMLRDDGFEVLVAADGAVAVGYLARALPDALVTDMRLHRLDGLVVAEYARSRRADLPIFFITDRPGPAEERIGALDPRPRVFVKPLDYDMLSAALGAALGAR